MLSNLKTKFDEFCSWWYAGILLCIPRRLRDKLIRIPDRIQILQMNDRIALRLIREPGGQVTAKQEFPLADADCPRQVGLWLKDHTDCTTRICLLVEPAALLSKDMCLPLASEPDLNEILRYELDRQTPFHADQVYFGHRIRKRDRQEGKLHARLFVLPRSRINVVRQLLHAQGIPLHAILAFADNDSGAEINLLSPDERSPANGGWDRNTLVYAILCTAIILAALYLPVLHQQNILRDSEEQLEAVKQQVREIQPMLDERDILVQRGRFLQEKRMAQIPAIELIAELSRILPDDTWINRLVMQDQGIQLYGESATETELIQILESSGYFHDAHFQSPVTYNNTSGKNNFHISAIAQRETGS